MSVARAGRADPGLDFEFGNTGRPAFEHLRADLMDPHFGMRIYLDAPVPGTLHNVPDPTTPDANARAAAPNGNHFFWDASFGEREPVFGWYGPRDACLPARACGVDFNLIAGAFLLIDLGSQSAGVIDTDYQIGGTVDARPWWPMWNRLSVSIGYYHQSSHLGDEYVLSAPTIQGRVGPPQVNPFLPYRANPSVEAFPLFGSADLPLFPSGFPAINVRLYGGVTFLARSVLPSGPQWEAGTEIRWDQPFLQEPTPSGDGSPRARARRWRRDLDFLLAYDVTLQRRYVHLGPEPGPPVFAEIDGYWVTNHGMLMALYNLDRERSSTNAIGVALEVLWGRVQHGQLPAYATVGTGSASLSYYW